MRELEPVGPSDSSLRSEVDAAHRSETDAVRANAAKTIFLRMASHELRTPLQALHLQLTRFERMNQDRSEDCDRLLAGLKRSARRLDDLCDAIQTYARVESDRLDVEPEDIAPVTVVTKVVEDVRSLSGGSVPPIALRVDSAPARFRTDPALLRSVVSNLLLTALKVASKAPIEIEVADAAGGLRVSITDPGGGIPERERGSFGQIDPTARGELSALGLGPTIAREIIRALGGSLSIHGTDSTQIVVLLPEARVTETGTA